MAIISGSSLHRLFPLLSTSYPNAPTDSFCSLAQPPISFPSLVSWGSSRHAIPRIPSSIAPAFKTLSNAELLALPPSASAEDVSWNVPLDSGVYAVYDRNDDLQFIGIARNIAASVRSHRNAVPELCCSVKVGLVDDPTKTALTQAWKSWMEEHVTATGKVPLGNEPGNSTWVRQVPRKKPDLRLMPNRHAQLAVPLEELIGQLVKEKRVVAFIKGSRNAPSCGFSEKVVGILEREGVEYESVDVLDEEHNGGLREALKGYSNWPTFPQVFVKGELVGGCNILSSMHERGELAGLLTG